MMSVFTAIIPIVSALILTPIVIWFWRRTVSKSSVSKFDELASDLLQKRNNWLDNMVAILMVVGIFLPILIMIPMPLWNAKAGWGAIWMLCLILGLMVDLPVAFVAIVTLPRGIGRYQEFWHYYAQRWHFGIRPLTIMYTYIGIVGVISLVMLLTF